MGQSDRRRDKRRPHDQNRPPPNKGPRNGEHGRQGTWAEIKTFEDPDSRMAIIVSERIRGAPAYSYQLVHIDSIGVNKYVPLPCPGAKHRPEDIAYSLVQKAREFVEARTAKDSGTRNEATSGG